MDKIPPPIIDSAELISFANPDEEGVEFTDRINLFVGNDADNMNRISEVPRLAICREFDNDEEYLLLFCNESWESKGVIAFPTCEAAMLKAERGYRGISSKWQPSPYTTTQVKEYCQSVYGAWSGSKAPDA